MHKQLMEESQGKGHMNPGHNRDEEEEQWFPVSGHVSFWKLDSDSEHADGKYDMDEFDGDHVGCFCWSVAPCTGVENV